VTRPTPRILATSGGFRLTERLGTFVPAGLTKAALRMTGKDRPRVVFVQTASGDDKAGLLRMYSAFRGWSVELSHLELFTWPNVDPRELLLGQDLIWVGGGSVANLLALWRVHGIDEIMREAWESGILLAGVSAGSICWHVGGPTDSFGPKLRPVTNGLAFLPYGNGVHYDTEEQRRPLLHQLVGDRVFPTSYATDDGVGILYEGTEPVAVLTDEGDGTDSDGASGGPAAYRVERTADGAVTEARLAPGPIG
jgi:peptidase E